jgi:ABC-type transport system involved in cytochrome c biogenesis permease component
MLADDTIKAERKKQKIILILWFLVGVMGVIAAIAGFPNPYFYIPRILLSLVSIVYLWYSIDAKWNASIVISAMLLALFNPLVLVNIYPESWGLIDLTAIIYFGYISFSRDFLVALTVPKVYRQFYKGVNNIYVSTKNHRRKFYRNEKGELEELKG